MRGLAYLGLLSAPAVGQEFVLAEVPAGYEVVADTLVFSPMSELVAYVATKDGAWHAGVGSKLDEGHEFVHPPVIDPAGKHVWFRFQSRDRKGVEQVSLVLDGKPIEKAGRIGPVAVNAEGVASYWRFENALKTGDCALVFGKKESRGWLMGDLLGAPRFSFDGKLALSVGSRGGEFRLVTMTAKGKDDSQGAGWVVAVEPSPTANEYLLTSVDLSTPLSQLEPEWNFWVAREAFGGELLEHYGEHLSCGSPVYSPDGRRFAMKVQGEEGMNVALGGQKKLGAFPYGFVDELVFSPDGGTLAFTACQGGTLTVPELFRKGKTRGTSVLEGVRSEGGTWKLVRGDRASAEYERVELPTWSPDGEKIACAVRQAGRWHVLVGTILSEPCDEIATILWENDGTRLRYGCRDGRKLLWRELDVP